MPTVLVVDDHAVTREPLVRVLRHEGFDALAAGNGLEAIEVLRDRPVDVMLLDLMMPKMSGIGLLEAMLTEPPPHGGPRVVVLTGTHDAGELTRAKELGASDVMIKSKFTLDDLLGRLRMEHGR